MNMTFVLVTNFETFTTVVCADPESFLRGFQLLQQFFLSFLLNMCAFPFLADKERKNLKLYTYHWPASQLPLKWRFSGLPMTAQH